MKIMLAIVIMITIQGCGNVGPDSAQAVAIPNGGAFFDSSVSDYFQRAMVKTKACLVKEGFESDKGEVANLTILVMLDDFECVDNSGRKTRCAGEFSSPDGMYLIRVSRTFEAFNHELTHFLLEVNSGDPDSAHANKSLWNHCA
jgi:hypothetical protein